MDKAELSLEMQQFAEKIERALMVARQDARIRAEQCGTKYLVWDKNGNFVGIDYSKKNKNSVTPNNEM